MDFDPRHAWFCTWSGKKLFVLDPKPEDICIEDIAGALSNLCRFNGHCDVFYSVAQHCIEVSYQVPKEWSLGGLLHDAAEAYLGDMIRPIKQVLPEFKELEKRWEKAIETAFDLQLTDEARAAIKEADSRMLLTERRDVAHRAWGFRTWKEDEQGVRPFDGILSPLPMSVNRQEFLARYRELRSR